MPQDPRARAVHAMMARGWSCVPCPLRSRERPVLTARGLEPALVRSSAGSPGRWQAEAPSEAWVEVLAGVGPARALVRLEAPPGERLPARYWLESAALGREGAGPWRPELTVVDNAARTRAHVIEFDGQGTLRVVFDAPGERAALTRLDVHDASDGTDDVWLVLGDELAGAGLSEHGGGRGFAEAVHGAYAGYYPALIDESCAGEGPAMTLARLAGLLERHPSACRVAVGFGAARPEALDAAPLEALARSLLDAGRIPIFSRAPWRAGSPRQVATFNARLDALELELGLARGPDPSAWAETWLAPDAALDAATLAALPAAARDALAALWAEAADVFYVPV